MHERMSDAATFFLVYFIAHGRREGARTIYSKVGSSITILQVGSSEVNSDLVPRFIFSLMCFYAYLLSYITYVSMLIHSICVSMLIYYLILCLSIILYINTTKMQYIWCKHSFLFAYLLYLIFSHTFCIFFSCLFILYQQGKLQSHSCQH